MRHGLLHLTLDVPTDDHLLDWANTVHKPLSGHVTFFETAQRTARETVSFAAGQCVSYREVVAAGDGQAGAYVCQLVITSEGLTLLPGGALLPFVPATARDYAYVLPGADLATRPYTGGRGPNGLGDTVGTFSNRPYDPASCGGPIADLSNLPKVI